MAEPVGTGIPVLDSVDGEPVPLLLAESPAVLAAVEVGSQRWLLPSADGSHPEQALIVWISMDPYGEDYDVTNVMVALPGHGMEEAVLVTAYDSPPLAVRFCSAIGPLSRLCSRWTSLWRRLWRTPSLPRRTA